MKLADLRKYAIRKQTRVHFPLKNGMECVINELGVAQVPALKQPPDFNLEEELTAAGTFVLEPVVPAGTRNPPKPVTMARGEFSTLTQEGHGAAATGHDEHEDE
jgi:hypothetical protein